MKKEPLLSAFFAILTGVGGALTIPLPIIPITMQTFVVLMSGFLLGPKYGPLSQALYVALGLLGLPIFAGGAGGLHHVMSPSFGFLLGFIAASWIAGLLSRKFLSDNDKVSAFRASAIAFAASGLMYAVAIPCFYLNMNYITRANTGGMTFLVALQVAFVPFIITDSIKAIAAGWLAARALPLLRKSGLL